MGMKYYHVNKKNQLIRTDMPMGFDDAWKFVGLVKLGPFSQYGQLIRPDKVLEIKDWLFKNGKSRYRLVDLDHGTIRIWFGPQQAVHSIYETK
jgi:hypothetical protein